MVFKLRLFRGTSVKKKFFLCQCGIERNVVMEMKMMMMRCYCEGLCGDDGVVVDYCISLLLGIAGTKWILQMALLLIDRIQVDLVTHLGFVKEALRLDDFMGQRVRMPAQLMVMIEVM